MTDSEFHENPDEHLADRLESISDEEAEKRATALEAGLEGYDLEDEDRALLDAYGFEFEAEEARGADPVLAVVGRPNVGKSTLVNRILGRREAVVEDVPGVTRDRVSYRAEWNTKEFTLVDTGGWDSDSKGMASRIAIQSEVAVDMADAVILVVDATTGPTSTDEMVVQMLRKKKKPVLLAANKVDDERGELMAAELWGLGLGQPWTVSGLHGRGVADLLDEVLGILPEVSAVETRIAEGGPRRIALVG
ncbi:MAG: 50S ribosome-binding GTPase, partial [Brevibacterium sp.]|nr:50S ribosome-binding GTPase [Brevibacterium sp.]MDN5910131.1 50S ribosome-binding GTPase [Brevibacterium sp.]